MDIVIHYCPVMTPDEPVQMIVRNTPEIPCTGDWFRINKIAYLVEKVSWEMALGALNVNGPTTQLTVNVFLEFVEDQSQM